MRHLYTAFIALFSHTLILGADSFQIVVPDSTNKQIVPIDVEATADQLSIDQGKPLSLPFSPSKIAVNPIDESLIVGGAQQGKSYASTVVSANDGALKLIGTSPLEKPLGYTSVDRAGRYYMAAHYASGALVIYAIEKNGRVGKVVHSLMAPNKEAHCILTTPDNRFVYIPHVKNNNALFQYAFDDASGQLQALEPFNAEPPAMFGPRHVAYHPTKPIAYFSNEQQLGVSAFEIASNGQLSDIQHASTIARRSPFEQGKRDLHASDIAITPSGNFVFVALRDFNGEEDSVFSFRVGNDGKLSLVQRVRVGDIPWKIGVSPSGNYLVVSESNDKRLAIFKIDPSGELSKAIGIELTSGARDMAVISASL